MIGKVTVTSIESYSYVILKRMYEENYNMFYNPIRKHYQYGMSDECKIPSKVTAMQVRKTQCKPFETMEYSIVIAQYNNVTKELKDVR